MRISKLLSAVCAVAVCAGVTAVRAQDTPAQAAALAALKQKMSELDTQAAVTTNQLLSPVVVTPSGVIPQQPSPPAEMQPRQGVIAVPQAKKSPPAPAPVPASDNSGFFTPVPPPSHPGAQAASQEKKPAPNPEPVPPQTTSPDATPVTPTKATLAAKPQTETAMKAVAKPAAQTPAKKEAEIKSSKKSDAKETPPAKPDVTSYPGKALGFNPVEPPPPPVTAEQEAALHALLARYMANEITPDQYQAERKQILAGR